MRPSLSAVPFRDVSDSELLGDVQDGNAESFGMLFDRYAPVVYRQCLRHTQQAADAEDALSVVFLQAFQSCRRAFLCDDSLLPWLIGVTRNVLRNLSRAMRRHSQALQRFHVEESQVSQDHSDSVASAVDAERVASQIPYAVGVLNDREREVLQLCLVENLSLETVASRLGIPEGTVKSRLFRARRALKDSLLQTGEQWELLTEPRHELGEGHRGLPVGRSK